jgi:superfamily I DNA and/or RNA helicase
MSVLGAVSPLATSLLEHPELVGIVISTVDSMQGRENMVILYDMTATGSSGGHYSFLSGLRRLCVALTRHKNGLIIIGDPSIDISGITVRTAPITDQQIRNNSDLSR